MSRRAPRRLGGRWSPKKIFRFFVNRNRRRSPSVIHRKNTRNGTKTGGFIRPPPPPNSTFYPGACLRRHGALGGAPAALRAQFTLGFARASSVSYRRLQQRPLLRVLWSQAICQRRPIDDKQRQIACVLTCSCSISTSGSYSGCCGQKRSVRDGLLMTSNGRLPVYLPAAASSSGFRARFFVANRSS